MSKNQNLASPTTRFVLYTSSQGNYFFHEIRDLIGAGLRELGLTVEFRDERAGFAPKADWHLVIAPHEFFLLGTGRDLVSKPWPANLILFNTEQPSSYELGLAAKHFERAAAIWDIDFDSSLRICKRGYACDYLPLGHVANSPMLQEVTQLPLIEETRSLPTDVRDFSGFRQSFARRPVDLLFLGHSSPRREKYFARHAARLNRHNCFFHTPSVARPLIPGQTTNMNTLTSVGLSQRSKILLNVHHGVDKYFEWHRIALLGIAQRTLVISEPCSIAPPFQANVDYVEAPLDELPDRIEYFLGSPAGQAEAQRIIEHGFETMTARCRLSDMLRPLVEKLNTPASAHITTAERFFPVATSPIKNPRPLSLCVVTPDVAGEGPHGDCGSAQVELARTLALSGHKVTLLHTEAQYGAGFSVGHWRKYFSERAIDYVPLPTNIQVPVEGTEASTRSYETYLWLRGQSFDIVHLPETHGIGFYSLLAKNQGLEFSQTRFCLNAHSPRAWRRQASQQFVNNAYELELDFLERECFSRADALVTSTQFMRGWLEQQNWALPAERRLRPNPLNSSSRGNEALISSSARSAPRDLSLLTSAATNLYAPTRVRELVYLGPLNKCPGLALFCDALERLGPDALRKTTITFADDSTTPKGPRALEYLYDRTRQWTFTWQIAQTEPSTLNDYLKGEGRLTVLPSPMENSPLTVRRCLTLGVPFLAAQCDGVAELINAADHEKVFYSGTSVALAASLQKAIKEPITAAHPVETATRIQSWLQWHQGWATTNQPQATTPNEAQPLVSVCLVHFNRPEFLTQALASLRDQDYPNFEVVLVDDGSTKPEAIKFLAGLEAEFKQRNWQIVRQENRYLGAARNNAARHAHGEFIVFMDDDNFAKPNQLSTFVRVAHKTGAEIVTSAMDLFTGIKPPQLNAKPKARWIFLGGAAGTGAFRNCFGDANGCIRRETFERLGGFSEDYGITHEDWEFYARAVLQGCRMETLPEALFWYRVADQSMIRSTPQYANHQRSLRPYLAAVPAPLQGLVHCLQGSILFPADKNIPHPGHENLLHLHRRLVVIAKELISAGQNNSAEAIFLEAIQSAESTQHPGIVLQTLLDIGNALVENGRGQLAEKLLDRALKIARAGCDSIAIKEAEGLLAAAKLDRHSKPKNGALNSSEAARTLFQGQAPKSSSKTEVFFKAPAAPAQSNSVVAEKPLASIVIPVFNKLALTRNCLDSLARTANAHQPEIIIVDNASTDGTAEFLKAEQDAGRVHVITNEQNKGFAQACNLGSQAAHGSILLFLNNDTQVTDGWIDALVQAAQQPNVGVVGAKLLYADGRIQHAGIEFINGLPDHPHRHAPGDAPVVNQFRELDMVTGACFLIHRDLFLQLAGFDEIYRNGVEDVDLCLRVRAAGRKVIYEPRSVVYHLEGQSEGRFNHVQENLAIFFQRWGKSFDGKMRFIAKTPLKISPASRSVLLAATAKSPTKRINTAWEGSFLDFGSLSHVNRELTRALADAENVRLQCVNSPALPKDSIVPKELKKLADTLAKKSPADTQVTIRHAWPPNWQRPAQGKLVVIQPWEFGSLPQAWVEQAKNVDEFWVPTNYVRNVYTESGIAADKVQIVPNGIDPERFHPDARPRNIATDKAFKFLFVGGTIPRKGTDILLDAFLKAFTASDDVALIIKDFGGNTFYKGQTLGHRVAEYQRRPNAPQIIYLDTELAPEELPGLYTACDCLVHPYRGEGFGLPVLEAMACGLPVVVTAGGATDDFATDEFAYRVPAVRRGIGHEISGMKLAGEAWLLEPYVDALAERLCWITANRAAARELGQKAGEHVRQNWTWNRAAETALAHLQKLSAVSATPEPPKTAPVQIEPAPVALIGNLKSARAAFERHDLKTAWNETLAAISARPFHPEAFFQLAEIALAANDGRSARQCAEHAHELAPNWNAPKLFLKKPLTGSAKLDWLQPSAILHPPSSRRLSICLITRNEEKFLGQCLKSVRGLAQQIVVVDTGSTDRTLEIAREHGAEIYSFAWHDDFSAARNVALEHATGDWILMLDADEELPAARHDHLLTDIKQSEAIGIRLPLVNQGQEASGQSFVPRLFRNAPGVFYHGRIHEQVFPSLVALGKAWGLPIGLGSAQILHHGYSKEMIQDRSKIERNLRLLRLAVEENPGDANLAMNFGLELVRSGDLPAGIEKYRAAFELMSAQTPGEVVPELREVLLTQFTSQLYKVRAHEEVVRVLSSPLAKNGGLTASLHFSLGLSNFELQNYHEAAGQMRQCLLKRHQPALSPINTDIHTAAPQHCLALSLVRLGDMTDAEKAFQTALTETSRTEDVKVDYAKFLASQNKPLEALQQLNEIISQNSQHARAWRLGGEIALSQPEFLEFARDWTGEAMRNLAEDIAITAQRAEALLLSGDTAAARELWERIYTCDHQPRALAALILCEVTELKLEHGPEDEAQEMATSREFVGWYQKLLAIKSQPALERLNEQTERLASALPTAAGIIEKALFEAENFQTVAA